MKDDATPSSSATVVHAEHSGQNTVSQPKCLKHRVSTHMSQTPCLNPNVSNTLSRPHCPKHSVEHSDSAQTTTTQQLKNCATGVLRDKRVNLNHMSLILFGNLVAEEGLEPPTRGL